jgi:transposase
MSYRELMMIDVREVLRRRAAGQATRKIARETGPDRKTVGRYVDAMQELGVARDVELTDEVVHEVAQRVQARRAPTASEERLELAEHRVRIEACLGQKRPLRLSKVHRLLTRDHGVRASYHTLRRFVVVSAARAPS